MKKSYPFLLLCILASGCADMGSMSSDDSMIKDKKMDTMSSDSMNTMEHDRMKKEKDTGMSEMPDESM